MSSEFEKGKCHHNIQPDGLPDGHKNPFIYRTFQHIEFDIYFRLTFSHKKKLFFGST